MGLTTYVQGGEGYRRVDCCRNPCGSFEFIAFDKAGNINGQQFTGKSKLKIVKIIQASNGYDQDNRF